MRVLSKEAWRYGILLIVLFAIAAQAVSHTLIYISGHLSGMQFSVIAILLWAISLGFMLIAGAFGLWAIQFSAEAESLRRIGRLVDSMDYLRDGLLALDPKGKITGSNPEVRKMVGSDLSDPCSLNDIFPCLSDADIALLLNKSEPSEVEREFTHDGVTRTLRFRSQPSDGLFMILVGDVTSMSLQQHHNRQSARLQLIGQIARGVANDFNNILCIISGHASLLNRLPAGSAELDSSIREIVSSTDRGTALAAHLLELSRPAFAAQITNAAHDYVKSTVKVVTDTLSTDWDVESQIPDLPPVGLTGMQIEQVVLNLSLIAADAFNAPASLTVTANTPGAGGLFNIDNKCAAVLLVSAAPKNADATTDHHTIKDSSTDSGVLISVIQSMLEEAGGALHHLAGTSGSEVFRIILPHPNILVRMEDTPEIASQIQGYIKTWSILLAGPAKPTTALETRLRELGSAVTVVDNISSTLAHIEEAPNLDMIVLEKLLLSQEMKGLLRAIAKLRPSAGIVVLCDDPASEGPDMANDVVFASEASGEDNLLSAMIDARNLAASRSS